jgi:hypothetical protein
MDGKITDWNAFNGRGEVSGTDGTHMVSAGDCSSGLRAVLRNTAIPPDDPIEVTYDVAGTGEAIDVDRALTLTLAAFAAPAAQRSFAVKAAPPTKAPQPPSPKKAVTPKRPAKKATSKTADRKKTAAKKKTATKKRR